MGMKQHAPRFLEIVLAAKRQVRETTVDEVAQRLGQHNAPVLIDVREDHEWAQGHLPRAVHLAKGIIERDIEKQYPDPDTALILYCGGGYRSALATEALQRMGYTNVLSMDGGFSGWKEKGHPVTSDS
jgi:rhodanese-related sulfurtransferase